MRLILFTGILFCLGFSGTDWDAKKWAAANTAGTSSWQSTEEQEIFTYVNLARMYPKEFAEKYVKPEIKHSAYHRSLYNTMVVMKPLKAIMPDKTLYDFALCFAKEAGKSGYVGHQRKKCKNGSFAECCSYGASGSLGVVMQLLADVNVPSLGHRKILLDQYSTKMGVSTQPHKTYGSNTVIDIQ